MSVSYQDLKAAKAANRKSKAKGKQLEALDLYGPLVLKMRCCTGCGWTYEMEERENAPFTFWYCEGCERQNSYIDKEESAYYAEQYRIYLEEQKAAL